MSWQHIRGHDAQVREFTHAFRKGRLAHAYLFTGPPGVGKRLFAQELAKTLLCERSAQAEVWQACDVCHACRLVDAGTHADLMAAGRPEDVNELPIKVVRELCQALALKAAHGRAKIAILDDADDLNDSAANSFLKTLEEPPPHAHLILIGTSADLQLPTILSRCQVVQFAPLPTDLVAELLRDQGIEDTGLIARVARLSGGSPGQALALADPDLWEFRRLFLKALAQPPLDSVGLAQQWLQFVEKAGKESGAQRRRAGLTVRLLLDFLNDALRLCVGGPPRGTEAADVPFLKQLAERLPPEALLAALDRCLEADVQLNRYVQLVLVLEALTDALARRLAC